MSSLDILFPPPNIRLLTGRLSHLVNWYNFGVLLGVPTHILQKIEKEHPFSSTRCKAELFDYWLKNCEDPTWFRVAESLYEAGEQELYQEINKEFCGIGCDNDREIAALKPQNVVTITDEDKLASSLESMLAKFASLVVEIRTSLEICQTRFDDILQFTCEFLCIKLQQEPKTLFKFFEQLRPHYCFLNYKVLKVIVNNFVKESMEHRLVEYGAQVEVWLKSTTVAEFKVALEQKVEQPENLSDSLCPVMPVIIRLQGDWLPVMVHKLNKLLEYVFKHKRSILSRIKVVTGSVIVRLTAPHHELLPLLALSSKVVSNSSFLGIISIQIGRVVMQLQHVNLAFSFKRSLFVATTFGDHSAVVALCMLGIVDTNINVMGAIPLTYASQTGNTAIVSTLLDYGANVNFESSDGTIALDNAAQGGHVEIAKMLIKAGSYIDHQSHFGVSPLMVASFFNKKDVVELLLRHKANLDTRDNNGESALMAVSSYNLSSVVELLLKAGANPNLRHSKGFTALGKAAIHGHIDSAQLLIQYKADLNIASNEGFTPLMAASQSGYNNIVNLLVNAGAKLDLQADMGHTALMIAYYNNQPAVVTTLIEAKANVNIQDHKGSTLLTDAIVKQDRQTVKQLLQAKANPNFLFSNGSSPLQLACVMDEDAIVDLLIKAGGLVNLAGGPELETPLHKACKSGNVEIVNILLSNGAVPNLLNLHGLTPLCIASTTGNVAIVHALLEAKADTELQSNEQRWTPLFFAAHDGQEEIVQLLLEHGASAKENKFGLTPIMVATQKGYNKLAELLLKPARTTTPTEAFTPSLENQGKMSKSLDSFLKSTYAYISSDPQTMKDTHKQTMKLITFSNTHAEVLA